MSDYDPTDFVDSDFQAHKTPRPSTTTTVTGVAAQRAPSREEVDAKVVDAQQRLAELKRAQEELERERATLEESRRRRKEFETGRQELVHNLTRGLGLMEEAEFNSRRDAEQLAKALTALREALEKLDAIHEDTWTKENFDVELTRALTTIENARMEWNSARLKFAVLSGGTPASAQPQSSVPAHEQAPWTQCGFGQLCKIGLGLTWPVALAILISLGVVLVFVVRW
jgi:chromosome segregation ATPase